MDPNLCQLTVGRCHLSVSHCHVVVERGDGGDSRCRCRVSCCRVDVQRPPGQSVSLFYTYDVQGLQRELTVCETVLARVTSRHPDRVVPWAWRDRATMRRETSYDEASDMWRWQWDVVLIREVIDSTRAGLRDLLEAASESH